MRRLLHVVVELRLIRLGGDLGRCPICRIRRHIGNAGATRRLALLDVS